MKILIFILLSLSLANGAFAQYSFSFNTIEGQQHTLSEYQGQRIWIIVLPSTQTSDDSTWLTRVDSIALAHAGQMKTIAVPSYEDGYADSMLAVLQPFYRNFLDTSISISTGMYTHQASGSQQNPLFSWLTFASQNNAFQQEVGGPGEMYFINTLGNLIGVYGPPAKYSNKTINNVFQQPN